MNMTLFNPAKPREETWEEYQDRKKAEARERGWLGEDALVDGGGVQAAVIGYPHLGRTEIFASVETFYRRFYFRPRKIFAIGGEMVRDPAVGLRRLKEGAEFLRFLASRR